MSLSEYRLDQLAAAPESIVFESLDSLFGLSREQYEKLQLSALKTRFSGLRNMVPALTKLADGLGITQIESLEAAGPLLFQHVIYKSYPLALIERGDFFKLTKWLGGLTSHDLSSLDMTRIELIDDWLKYLDENSPLRVVHSTGTSGKLSFLPRSIQEMPAYVKSMLSFCAGFGNEPDLMPTKDIAMVIPAYRHGFNAGPRMLQAIINELHIPESGCLALYDFMSADLMSLAGRLRTAEAKGEAGKLSMSSNMQNLRDRLIKQRTNDVDAFRQFFDVVLSSLHGRRVWMVSTIPQLYRAAQTAKENGITHVFDSRSIVHTGGGFKGENLPVDYMKTICDFVGVESVKETYGMTEMMSFIGICPKGYFHVQPQLIPYVLDPDSGNMQPRCGVQSGRFGFIDLLPQTYWGGFLTGDYVTVDWEIQCECGRTGGPVIYRKIERLAEKRGGDDKINCAGGADEAHDRAVQFLLESP